MNAIDLAKVADKLPLSESTRRLNLGLEAQPSGAAEQPKLGKGVTPNTPRTRKCRMNKLELRFYDILKERFKTPPTAVPSMCITPQFRFRISAWDAPVPCFYTADFLTSGEVEKLRWYHVAYEVKDSRRKPHSDELTRPKMLREHNPWISAVILATWDGSKWIERTIA